MRFPGMEYTKPMFDCRTGSPMPKDYQGPVVHHDNTATKERGIAGTWTVWRTCLACGEVFGESHVQTDSLPAELKK